MGTDEGQRQEFIKALVAFQGQMRNIPKDGVNPHFRSKYATLAAVLDVVREPLANNGLAITFSTQWEREHLVVTAALFHIGGAWLSSSIEIPIIQAGKPATPQVIGSAQTYGMRYSVMALLAITAEDDDGNAAQEQAARPQAQWNPPKENTPAHAPAPAPRWNRQEIIDRVKNLINEAKNNGIPIPTSIEIARATEEDLVEYGKSLKETIRDAYHPSMQEQGVEVEAQGTVLSHFANEKVSKLTLQTEQGILPVTVFFKNDFFSLASHLQKGEIVKVRGRVECPEKYPPSVIAEFLAVVDEEEEEEEEEEEDRIPY